MRIDSPLKLHNDDFILDENLYTTKTDVYLESGLHQAVVKHLSDVFNTDSNYDVFDSSAAFAKGQTELSAQQVSEVHRLCDQSQYHFLLSLDYAGINGALDLTQDCGDVTHFIADRVNYVDSVKTDYALAQLSAKRCASRPNSSHFFCDYKKIDFPKSTYDLIVIGQLEELNLEQEALSDLIGTLRESLTPSGMLLINAGNANRLSRILNHGNTSVRFGDSYVPRCETNALSLTELRRTALAHNFNKIKIFATFSQGQRIDNLFSEDYLTSNIHCLNHFYNLGYLDDTERSEYLLFSSLAQDKERLFDLASRYLLVIGHAADTVNRLIDLDFAHYPRADAQEQGRQITSRQRSSSSVSRRAINDSLQHGSQVPYVKGELLAAAWLKLMLNGDINQLKTEVARFHSWLTSLEMNQFQQSALALLASTVIIQARSGEYCCINSQPEKATDASINQVLLRTLFWFAVENEPVFNAFTQQHDIHSIANFVERCLPELALEQEFETFVSNEQIQHDLSVLETHRIDISSRFHQIIGEPSTTPLNDQTSALSNALDRKDQSLALTQKEITGNLERIHQLKQHRDDLLELVETVEQRVKTERNVQGNLYAQIEHLQARLHARRIENEELNKFNKELHQFLLMRPSTRIKNSIRGWINRLKGTAPAIEEVEPEPITIENENPYREVEQEPPFDQLPEGKLIGMNTEDYDQWIAENTLTEEQIEAAKAEIEAMPYKPVFSILVPVYNTDPEYLLPMIESVRNQIYPHWQLCLVDDCSPNTYLKAILQQQAIDDDRIVIKLNDVNQGISITTNDALDIATGDYIALLDHDDEITIDALYENAKLINAQPDAELIYSDEDKMELDGTRIEPYFKPDFSPDLLDTNNYVCHFTVMKKSVMENIGGFREGLDGSQDHDVILRASRVAKEVAHIPRVLYHWRKIPGSTAVEYDSKGYAWEAGRKSIENLHRQYDDNVRVELGTLKGSYRVIRDIKAEPLVTIVIPFKDKPELLDSCIGSILNRSSYANFEVLGVSNNSEQELTHDRMAYFSGLDQRIRFIEHNVPFNFSDICNFGVDQAKGEYVVLLNNDIEILSPDWIQDMLQHAQRDHVGAVGTKLIFPDGRIQHAGVVAGMVGAAGHPHKFFPEEHIGYNGRLHMVSNVSAVTGAMLMVAKEKYQQVGGLDSENLAVAYNDIDFCLKLIERGYLNVFTPYARAIHHESISRGYEDTDEKLQRLLKEQRHFLTRWDDYLTKGDPFYNPNMSLKNERFSFNFKD